MSARCAAAVDGRGVERVASIVAAGPHLPLRARPTEPRDEQLILRWANDPASRANAFNVAMILPTDHHRWFRRRLRDLERCHMFMVETNAAAAVGHVRFEREGDVWVVSYSVAPAFRGARVGHRVLAEGLQALCDAGIHGRVVGHVKPTNVRSAAVFRRLGFVGAEQGTRWTFHREIGSVQVP
jgi:RimJ/RimL family protein N-acetyltransferase